METELGSVINQDHQVDRMRGTSAKPWNRSTQTQKHTHTHCRWVPAGCKPKATDSVQALPLLWPYTSMVMKEWGARQLPQLAYPRVTYSIMLFCSWQWSCTYIRIYNPNCVCGFVCAWRALPLTPINNPQIYLWVTHILHHSPTKFWCGQGLQKVDLFSA